MKVLIPVMGTTGYVTTENDTSVYVEFCNFRLTNQWILKSLVVEI